MYWIDLSLLTDINLVQDLLVSLDREELHGLRVMTRLARLF